jgi:pimeloyl-ACP methyl ester carboxylesterase
MYGSSRSGFAHVNGIALHYREWGERDSPDLLLVHGWSTASVVWIAVAEALKDSYHIIAPDNRGTGEFERPATGYLLRDYALDVHHLIEALQLQQPF